MSDIMGTIFTYLAGLILFGFAFAGVALVTGIDPLTLLGLTVAVILVMSVITAVIVLVPKFLSRRAAAARGVLPE